MRKAFAAALLLIWLAAYIVGAVTLADRLDLTAWWAQLIYFAVAGVLWAIPIGPILRWANAKG